MTSKIVKDIELLAQAIEKWWGVQQGALELGLIDCSLCNVYFNDQNCEQCPITIEVGERRCRSTPYQDWSRHQKSVHGADGHRYVYVGCKKCAELSFRERVFLERLRDKLL